MNKEDSLSFIRSELTKTLLDDQKRLSKEEILEIVIFMMKINPQKVQNK